MDLEQLKVLNAQLQNLLGMRNGGDRVERRVVHEIDDEYDSQGDSNEIYETYKTPIDGVFIQIQLGSDSYGYNEFVSGVKFVTPTVKQVTTYE